MSTGAGTTGVHVRWGTNENPRYSSCLLIMMLQQLVPVQEVRK